MLALLKYLSKIAPRRFDAVKQNELTKVLMRQRRNGLLAQRQSSGLLIHWSRVRSPHNPPLISCILSGSLAQLVEQRTLNPLVAGSNPSRPTMLWMLSSVWLEHLPYKQRVIGSSPIASTIFLKNRKVLIFYPFVVSIKILNKSTHILTFHNFQLPVRCLIRLIAYLFPYIANLKP